VNTQATVLLPREAPISKRRAPPVAPAIKERAKKSLAYWVELARQRFKLPLFMPTISFDLVGTTAGKAFLLQRHVQLNAVLLTENLESFEQDTIPHELAHLIVYHVLGRSGGHGPEWKEAMRRLGLDPKRTHNYDVANSRTTAQVTGYTCGCGHHPVSPKMHNKIRLGARARCKKCGQRLQWKGVPAPTFRPKPPPAPARPVPAPPRPAARPPSEAMLRFAEALAQKHKMVVPADVLADFEACRAFLDKWSKAPAVAAPLVAKPEPPFKPVTSAGGEFPPTERQLSFAQSIARRKKLVIPPEVLKSKQKVSQWIDQHSK
jgi:SprT protein